MRLVRDYRPGEASDLAQLFYETVHSLNAADYTPAQLAAWAPEVPDGAKWEERMAANHTYVAYEEDKLLGFVELTDKGLVHMLYCQKDADREGVGGLLLERVEARAKYLKLGSLTVKSSATSLSFFENNGFKPVKKQMVLRQGTALQTVLMEKGL